jgi:hypothetical protein
LDHYALLLNELLFLLHYLANQFCPTISERKHDHQDAVPAHFHSLYSDSSKSGFPQRAEIHVINPAIIRIGSWQRLCKSSESSPKQQVLSPLLY